MKVLLGIAFFMVIVICSGCSKDSIAVEEQNCGSCSGSACAIPGTEDKAVNQKTMTRRIPVVSMNKQENKNIDALSGDQGHYNDVKLAGMGHEDVVAEQSFFIRSFNRSIWPGGVPLEAEIDPGIMNF